GPSFQGIQRVWQSADEVWGFVQLPGLPAPEAYRFHPALLDSCLQLLVMLFSSKAETEGSIYLLRGIDRFEVSGPIGTSLWCQATPRVLENSDNRLFAGDLRMFDEADRLVAEVSGVYVKRANREALQVATPARLNDCVYEVQWLPDSPTGEPEREGHSQQPLTPASAHRAASEEGQIDMAIE